MKNLLLIMLIVPMAAMVQPTSVDDITKAINQGDADRLSQYFDDNVEISIMGKVYDRTKAKIALKTFFSKHKPAKFSRKHKGVSKGKSSQYIIGNLVTADQSYRLFLQMKVNNGAYSVEELSIDEE